MREIKFRAFDPYNRIMYKPTRDEDALTGASYELAMWDGGWEMTSISAMGKKPVVASQTRTGETGGVLMQYTGLKDKNGVEIYEGDIVVRYDKNERGYLYRKSNTVRVIEWRSSFNETGFNIGSSSRLEVIGNIYENPELLEAQS